MESGLKICVASTRSLLNVALLVQKNTKLSGRTCPIACSDASSHGRPKARRDVKSFWLRVQDARLNGMLRVSLRECVLLIDKKLPNYEALVLLAREPLLPFIQRVPVMSSFSTVK
jgi:hypothetical protein